MGVDYASREEMAVQSPISDEEYRDRSVPFSCCNLRAMSPCEHTEILEADIKTINTNGCAEIVSPVLLRIVIVAYVMTSTLVIIQVFLAFLITKIIRKLLCGTCRFYHMQRTFITESTSASLEATSSDTERRASSSSRSNWETRSTRTTKRRDKRKRYDKRVSSTTTKYIRSKNKGNAKDGYSSSSPFDSSPSCRTRGICGAARIRPSVHEEHTISKKPLCQA